MNRWSAAAGVSGLVFVGILAGWSVWVGAARATNGESAAEVQALRDEIDTLRWQVCEELMLAEASLDLFKIEVWSELGLPASGPPGAGWPDAADAAVNEILERVYAESPRVDRLVHPDC